MVLSSFCYFLSSIENLRGHTLAPSLALNLSGCNLLASWNGSVLDHAAFTCQADAAVSSTFSKAAAAALNFRSSSIRAFWKKSPLPDGQTAEYHHRPTQGEYASEHSFSQVNRTTWSHFSPQRRGRSPLTQPKQEAGSPLPIPNSMALTFCAASCSKIYQDPPRGVYK